MSVQFSGVVLSVWGRIIVLYGRKSQTKAQQLLAGVGCLYQLGGAVFMVDDNFIGNKRNVKLLLKS